MKIGVQDILVCHPLGSLIRCTPKVAFRALDLSIKRSGPFPSDLKTDQKVIFEI